MTKSSFTRVVLIIVGVSLTGWAFATSDDRNVIKIEIEEEKTKSVQFENLCLVPGASCEYVIKLKGDSARKYDIHLDFV